MKAAVIPQYEALLDGELFDFEGYNPMLPYGTDRIAFHELKKTFDEAGDELVTIDRANPSDLDVCIFIDMNFRYLSEFARLDDPPALVYVMREPPSVRWYNAASQLPRFAPLFEAVFTWNGTLADVDGPFIEYDIPQYLEPEREGMKPFDDRKLLVNVTSRKYSTHPEELYTAREDVLRYYDRHPLDDCTLYGRYWNQRPRPEDVYHHKKISSHEYRIYEGLVDDKMAAYHDHRFALCFENMTGIDGYITEKIFDCFRAGTVPVYWGASDISDQVPRDAFIDYREFGSPESLHEFLTSVDETRYQRYLDAATEFLLSGIEDVSPVTYARTIHSRVETISPDARFELPEHLAAEVHARGSAERLETNANDLTMAERIRELVHLLQTRPQTLLENPSSVLNSIKLPFSR